ncbi:MAG TPA: hypothetical protein VIH26_10805 [Anaerolineales bacterium]
MAWRVGDLLGVRVQTQKPRLPADGPLTPALRAMAETGPGGGPISLAGSELNRLVTPLTIRVAFLPTSGSGATPWRNWLVLDTSYRGSGQASSPARVGLVAHELTHVLQRELGDPQFWPAGTLRPSRSRRWLGDSTNYMEVLAYLIGASVELDLLEAKGTAAGQRLLDDLATFAGEDAPNATRYVAKRFPSNTTYRKNVLEEARSPDRRIPAGGWTHWLQRLGYSAAVVERVQAQAARGHPQRAEPELVGPPSG